MRDGDSDDLSAMDWVIIVLLALAVLGIFGGTVLLLLGALGL